MGDPLQLSDIVKPELIKTEEPLEIFSNDNLEDESDANLIPPGFIDCGNLSEPIEVEEPSSIVPSVKNKRKLNAQFKLTGRECDNGENDGSEKSNFAKRFKCISKSKSHDNGGNSSLGDEDECDAIAVTPSTPPPLLWYNDCERSRDVEVNAEGTTVKYTVNDIKKLNFKALSTEEQIRIKENRPTPLLNLTQRSIPASRTFKREFKMVVYEMCPWICGCEDTNKLFCFPCLLFYGQQGDYFWVNSGISHLGHISQKIKKHESSLMHLNAMLDFNLLGKVDVSREFDSNLRENIKKHNEQVTKNRHVLSKLIDCLKFCGEFELALRDHREYDDFLNPCLFEGLVSFSTELDPYLKECLNTCGVLIGSCEEIKNELLDCMLFVCQENIRDEIKTAPCVSLIVDEISDISSEVQLVIVFRYTLTTGEPVERFWKFDRPEELEAESIAKCIFTTLDYVVQPREKLISQSYEGPNITSEHGTSVRDIVQRTYKHAFYVHCYAHQLNSIVANAASQNRDVRLFFSGLSYITNFFSNSPPRMAVLNNIIGKRTPGVPASISDIKNKTVETVHKYKQELMECIEVIRSTSNEPMAIIEAGAVARLLQDQDFIFWLSVFNRLTPHVEFWFNQLQLASKDAIKVKANVKRFVHVIDQDRDFMDKLTEQVYQNHENSPDQSKREDLQPSKPVTCGCDIKTKIQSMFKSLNKTAAAKETCDAIKTQVQSRFRFTVTCSAASLFDPQKFEEYAKKFPEKKLIDTVNSYTLIDKNKLKTELEVIYSRKDLRSISGAPGILQFCIANNLSESFSECYKLLSIIVTIPSTTPKAEGCFSTLTRIKRFLRTTSSQGRLTALAMLAIEKDMISNIHNFNEKVIDVFVSREKRVGFAYKKVA